MTKKDYELIASTIAGRLDNTRNLDKLGWGEGEIETGVAVLEDAAMFLAYDLARANDKFNRSKFLQACGLEA